MKNILLVFILLSLLQSIHAQTTEVNGFVRHLGGSLDNPLRISTNGTQNWNSIDNVNGSIGYWGVFTGPFDMDFGTEGGNTNGKVQLVTEAIPRLTVAADGNVGIGNTSPSAKLDVSGDVKISGDVTIGQATQINSSTNAMIRQTDGTIAVGPKLAMGTYTPTWTTLEGFKGQTPTTRTCDYSRVGNIVTVVCLFNICSFDLNVNKASLSVPQNLPVKQIGVLSQISGTFYSDFFKNLDQNENGKVVHDGTDNVRLQVNNSAGSSFASCFCDFTYRTSAE